MKRKTFDCVEMKNRIQAQRLAEYRATESQSTSYIDFILARSEKSEWVKRMVQKIARQQKRG